MSKYILYLIFLCISFKAFAQNDTEISMPNKVSDSIYTERKFSENFKEKYSGSEFIYEYKPKAQSQWDRFLAWLSRTIDDIFTFGDKTKSTPAFVIIVRTIAVLILLFVVYMIVRAILNKEGIWIFGKSSKNIAVTTLSEENIHQMDFRKLVEETKNTKDFRLAIRFYYLWILKKMTVLEIIAFHPDKTNSDYTYEIKNSTLKKDFEYLSYLYDYSWYGEFSIDEEAFKKAEKSFLETLNKL